METSGKIPPKELSGDLVEAKNLWLSFFKDDSALTKLGYKPNQLPIVRSVLVPTLENPFEVIGDVKTAIFRNEDESKIVFLSHKLRHGGVSVEGYYDETHKTMKEERERFQDPQDALVVAILKGNPHDFLFDFFDDERGVVLSARLLPVLDGKEDLEKLIKRLYEGTENSLKAHVDIWEHNAINESKAVLSPAINALYNAVWIDDDTMVVETDYDSKGEGEFGEEGKKVVHVWRRLPEITVSGKNWTPWGRVPHFSEKTALNYLKK